MPTKIKLSNGGLAIVNNADAALVLTHGRTWKGKRVWRRQDGGRISYAVGWVNGKSVLMHRLILRPPRGKKVDHKNWNGLDNRRGNLRACTQSQNLMNGRAHAGSATGLKGVCFHSKARGKKFVARGWARGKRLYLGSFVTAIEAHRAYVAWARKAHGEFFRAG